MTIAPSPPPPPNTESPFLLSLPLLGEKGNKARNFHFPHLALRKRWGKGRGGGREKAIQKRRVKRRRVCWGEGEGAWKNTPCIQYTINHIRRITWLLWIGVISNLYVCQCLQGYQCTHTRYSKFSLCVCVFECVCVSIVGEHLSVLCVCHRVCNL